MREVTALFWDVGGVLLTNAWDRPARRKAVERFRLEWEEFEDRHELLVPAFEKGELSLEEYLDRTVFYCPRPFSKEEFREFMLAQSQPKSDTLGVVGGLARSKKYLLATVNNESVELNEYRIREFGLRDYFTVFFSSCYLGVRKPEERIYQLVLQLTQRSAEETVFIDDRPLNLECARRCGMIAIQFQSAGQLQADLRGVGVTA